VVEMEGIISKKPISILIDPSSNLSYISPQVVESCALQRKKHVKEEGLRQSEPHGLREKWQR
jgi:hypothetical protein